MTRIPPLDHGLCLEMEYSQVPLDLRRIRVERSGEDTILVGGLPTPLKNMIVSWDNEIPNTWKKTHHVPNQRYEFTQEFRLFVLKNVWRNTSRAKMVSSCFTCLCLGPVLGMKFGDFQEFCQIQNR